MKCPGQDSRYWKPGAIFEARCPECGNEVEFFKDDTTRACRKCGYRFLNPEMDFGCASYCKYAEQCVGPLSPELLAQKEDLLKNRVAIEMKRYFRQDFKRIGHAMRAARYAERIGKEEGGNLSAILIAAYLRDIGSAAKRIGTQEGKAANEYTKKNAQIAREILTKLGAPEPLIEEVCHIIEQESAPTPGDTINAKVVHDADLLAKLEEMQKETPLPHEEPENRLKGSFLTGSGREMARKVLSRQS